MSHEGIEVKIATDVINPFYGENGAAKVFGKQKGAFSNEIELLDEGLRIIANIVEIEFGLNLQNIPGSGAAGGLAGGSVVFLNGKIVSGTELIFNYCNLEEKIKSFFRETGIRMSVEIDPEMAQKEDLVKPKVLYSAKEKWDLLYAVNPEIEELRNALELKIDED